MTRSKLHTHESVLTAIRDLAGKQHMPPTVEELRCRLKVGSTRTVLRYLRDLEARGLISRHSGARGIRVVAHGGWQYTHERDAELIRKDGMMCEAHPGLEFGHDPECPGPGMAWVVEGRSTIEHLGSAAVPEPGAETWASVKTTCNFCGRHVEHVCTAFLKRDAAPAQL